MGGIREIKYNMVVSKLNNYLNTLTIMKYQNPPEMYYEDSKGYEIFACFSDATKIIIVRCPYFNNIDEELLFDVIKKFTKCENFSVEWNIY